jgi:hypothetical protein
MELHCPDCGLPIPAVEVAPAAGLAVCRFCERTYSLAACQEAAPIENRPELAPGPPPKGVTVTEGMDGFRVAVSTRSCLAFFLVPFTLFWAGGSLGGIYGTQIAKGEFNLLLSLFGIPFLIGSVFLIGFTLLTVAGSHVVELKGGRLESYVSVLGFRRGRSVNWADVESVRLTETSRRSRGRYVVTHEVEIAVRGEKPLALGSGADRDLLQWAVRFLAARIRRGR